MILLDTHALLWMTLGSDRLSKRAADAIDAAARSSELFVSPMSAWEIGLLVAKKRISLGRPPEDWLAEALAQPGLRVAELTPQIALGSSFLPGGFHPDPADRLLVATARAYDLSLVTADRKILAYAAAGHLKTIAA